jgi:uncharacterized repeat protein (TIGR03803 family)
MNISSRLISWSWFRWTSVRSPKTAVAIGAALLATVTAPWAQEQQALPPPLYTVLYTFTGGADGASPNNVGSGGMGLIRDKQDNLYGTTYAGGDLTSSLCASSGGCGVVFKLDSASKESVLHTFSGPDGSFPGAAPVEDDAGNLYGTTNYGGDLSECGGVGCGVVYKVDATGKETVLHSFTGGADGDVPFAGVIRDNAGNLYGTTIAGGLYAGGVVFKLDRAGNETVLHAFAGPDGNSPGAAPVQDDIGNLYGTTSGGGTYGPGVVYKLDPSGKYTVLHNFTGGADGGQPYDSLVRDYDGNLYGTASCGGLSGCPQGSRGVVFKLDPTGKYTALYSFTGGADGGQPYGSLLRWAGNLYGTTFFGGDLSGACGTIGCGVVFELDGSGKETVLCSFTGFADGANPYVGVISDWAGNLFGTTGYGGDLASTNPNCASSGCGVVFQIKQYV